MKLTVLLLCLVALSGHAQTVDFNTWFFPRTLRVDYLLAGDSRSETVFFSQMKEEPFWGGPHVNLVDPFGYGSYRYSASDSATGMQLFSRGFSTLFQEWRGTPEANSLRRAFPMTAVLPFPKKTILFTIEKRNYETNQFEHIFQRLINPEDYFINAENVHRLTVDKLVDSGDPANHVDIAFLAEGYTPEELPKFVTDARNMADYFLSVAPFSENRHKFSFYAVSSPSDESGVTVPGQDIYVNTSIGSAFYTFDMDRYLTTSNTKSVYDIAANVPYDAIFVLVNSKRYGGGGFYNHYAQGTVDHQLSKEVAIHEFGHEFAGLADEYYSSQVTYADFYNLKLEPWEPNITTNVDFAGKWKDLIASGIPMPTPREPANKEVVGMFEGGGYVSKGVFSPMMDCRMKSNEAKGFCPACQRAIARMIRFYCDTIPW